MDGAVDPRMEWPRVTQILAATGIADFSGIRNADYYLQRGADIHMACGSVLRGEPDYWTGTELEGFILGFQEFLKDTGFKATQIELPVFNAERRYRGTLDLLGEVNGKIWLPDLKSGIVASWVALQTAAYAACLPNPDQIIRCGVQLRKDGRYTISQQYKDYRTDINYFFSLVNTVHGRSLYGKCELLPED